MSRFDELLAELRQRRDELRVQMHLASKDLQDEWDEIEEKWDRFSARAGFEETEEGIEEALEKLGHELKLGYQRLRDAIRD